MNYIGSKQRLYPFIKEAIESTITMPLNQSVFCDLFAGTGIIGRIFKSKVKQIIANDMEYYSYILNSNYISNNEPIIFNEKIDILNKLKLTKRGKIYTRYCMGSGSGRQYFTDENGQRIDTIRQRINYWKKNNEITEKE